MPEILFDKPAKGFLYTPIYDEPVPDPNEPPTANAGADTTVTLPVNQVILNGQGNDSDGEIVAYEWSKVSSPSCTIVSPTTPTTSVTGLTEGVYIFQLKVTDNDGGESFDQRNVFVKPEIIVIPPPGDQPDFEVLYNKVSDVTDAQKGKGSFYPGTLLGLTGWFKSYVDDTAASNVSSGWRSEQVFGDEATPSRGIWEYNVIYEQPNYLVGGHDFQFHPETSGASSTISMWHSGGKFQVVRSVVKGANIYQQGNLMTIQKNFLYHMRWEINFSTESDGYCRLYINGKLYYSSTGKTGDGSGQYLKFGQNCFAAQKPPAVAYYKNLRVWKV